MASKQSKPPSKIFLKVLRDTGMLEQYGSATCSYCNTYWYSDEDYIDEDEKDESGKHCYSPEAIETVCLEAGKL